VEDKYEAAIIAIVFATVAALVIIQPWKAPEKPKPGPGQGTISVSTTPTGAKVYVGGTYIGTAPVSTNVDPGTYTVQAVYQGQSKTQSVTVAEGRTSSVSFTFVTAAFPEGFEDGNMQGWYHDTEIFSVQSTTVAKGQYAVEGDMISTERGVKWIGKDLSSPQTPDRIQVWMRYDPDTPSGGIVEFWVDEEATATAQSYEAMAAAGVSVNIRIKDGQMWYNSGSWNSFMSTRAGTWYRVEARNIDYGSNTYDIYVNGTLQKSGAEFRFGVTGVARIRLGFNTGGTGQFDQIEVQ